ncbi:hypothetical protein PILCRDRAFT_811776 [Piloderma croceum F 1598]|uniref:NAD(P)-binding domain-containing protein n=1 Tax=Piloderma croceum (strain F 1598) TaxID=765440 RepID=A0A0C3G4S4_PILCF|nr:hypothetical protein PILCRDRAFT_811776 [Piloderma croceum F 1598]
MSTKIKIFVTGATGYIGGSVVARLLEHPDSNTFEITALVRSAAKAAKLETLGLKTVIGSYSDLNQLELLTSEADVVFSTADCDNLDAIKAKLRGMKNRHEVTGSIPTLIHTSGTGELADMDAGGKFSYEHVFNDTNVEQIESLPSTAWHRHVDLEIVKADTQGYVKSYIVLPSTIYGLATGKLVDMGVQNRHSVQIPFLINASLARGQAGIVGEGKNVWPNVHIDETADLYITIYNSVLNSSTGHGREGYYFAENGEYSQYEAAKAISEAMFEFEKGAALEPTAFTTDELKRTPEVKQIYI